ncbi:MAG TPA: hypothetical protein VGD26_04170, partial [Chitinophagaceae bacterium]
FFLLATITILIFAGCKKEYSYEGGYSDAYCINCSYLPVCDSSEFIYVDSTVAGVDTTRTLMFILGDTLINGNKFSKITPLAAYSEGLIYNCDNQEYKTFFTISRLGINIDSIVNELSLILPLPVPIPPNLIQIPESALITFLKVNASVNSTWMDTLINVGLPPLLSGYVGLEHKILAKNVTRMVFQNSFGNVIHVQSTLRIVTSLTTIPVDLSIDTYFAKDVGIIEMEVKNAGETQILSKLYEYIL